MFKRSTKLLIAIFSVCLYSLISISPAEAEQYNLTGRISNSSGQGISGATFAVLEVNTATVVESVTSNSHGFYNINVEEGTYDIRVNPPSGLGLEISLTDDYEINGNSALNITLLPPPVDLHGTIVDRLGNTLEGVEVSFRNNENGVQYETLTEANGQYSFSVQPGNYHILFGGSSSGLVAGNLPQTWQVGTGEYNIDDDTVIDYSVDLKELEIKVVDTFGNSIENANINIDGLSVNNLILGGSQAFGSSTYRNGVDTNENGEVVTLLYPTDTDGAGYNIVVTPPENSPYSLTVEYNLKIEDNKQIEIELAPPVTVSGVVNDSSGNLLVNTDVFFRMNVTNIEYSTSTNQNGFYEIEIPKGEYQVMMEGGSTESGVAQLPQQWQALASSISINDNITLNHTVNVREIEFIVTDSSSQPAENVKIEVLDFTNNYLSIGSYQASGVSSHQSGVTTNSSGKAYMYLYETTVDGNYTFVFTPPEGSEYALSVRSDESLTADKTLNLQLTLPVTVTGNVSDQLGNPLGNTFVNLELPNVNKSFETTTNSSGNYSLEVPLGNYKVEMSGGSDINSSDNMPQTWQIIAENVPVSQDRTLNYVPLFKLIDVRVQNVNGSPIGNSVVAVDTGTIDNLILDGYLATGTSTYREGIATDEYGEVSLRLFANTGGGSLYTFEIAPPENSIYELVVADNVEVIEDDEKVFILESLNEGEPENIILFPIADSFIKQGGQNENEGASQMMRLQSSGKNRGLVQFSQEEIDQAIGSSENYTATLQFTITDNGNNWGNNGRTIDLHRLLEPWIEGNGFIVGNQPTFRGDSAGATWNCGIDDNTANQTDDCSSTWEMTNSSSWPFTTSPSTSTTITNNQEGVVEIDVTGDVQEFMNGTDNYGWVIKKTDEGANGRVEFGSRESGNPPTLTISFN